MIISFENNSPYCMALHSWGMEITKVPKEIIQALRNGEEIKEEKIEILRNFTDRLIKKKGHINDIE